MNAEDLPHTAYAVPICSPTYSSSGSCIPVLETLPIYYRTDPDAVRKRLPEALGVLDPVVTFEAAQ